jgi:hypothetical protein
MAGAAGRKQEGTGQRAPETAQGQKPSQKKARRPRRNGSRRREAASVAEQATRVPWADVVDDAADAACLVKPSSAIEPPAGGASMPDYSTVTDKSASDHRPRGRPPDSQSGELLKLIDKVIQMKKKIAPGEGASKHVDEQFLAACKQAFPA